MSANFALQDRFLELFFDSPLAEHFYLTGGTALARFYFNHRESLDLDLFTNDFGEDFSQVNQVIKALGLSELYLASALQNVEKIRLFPRMLQPLPWEDVKAFFQMLARELLNRIKPN